MPSKMRDHDETYDRAARDLEEKQPGIVVFSKEQFDALVRLLTPQYEASLMSIEIMRPEIERKRAHDAPVPGVPGSNAGSPATQSE